MGQFKPMSDDAIYQCETRYEIYKGKNPVKAVPTGKFAMRPPFIVRSDEIGLHAPRFRFDVVAIRRLEVGACFVDRNHNQWTRLK